MIRKHEDTRQAWRYINKCKGKSRNKGILSVKVPANGSWKELTTHQEVEAAIMDNNSNRFQLTSSTPLMSPYLSSKIGYVADTSYTLLLLDKTFTADPNLDEFTNAFLKLLGQRKQLSLCSAEVSSADFRAFWNGSR